MESVAYSRSVSKGVSLLRETEERNHAAQQIAHRTLTAAQVDDVLARYEPLYRTQLIRDASTWKIMREALHADTTKAWSLDRMLADSLEPRVVSKSPSTVLLITGSKYPPFPRLCAYDEEALPQARAENAAAFTEISNLTAIEAPRQYGMSLMRCDTYGILIAMHPHFENVRGENFSCWLETDNESRQKMLANEGSNVDGVARITQMFAHSVDLTRGWRGELVVSV